MQSLFKRSLSIPLILIGFSDELVLESIGGSGFPKKIRYGIEKQDLELNFTAATRPPNVRIVFILVSSIATFTFPSLGNKYYYC